MNNRKIENVLWTGLALASPIFPILLYFWGNWYSFFHSYSLGMVMGIISYVYFINALIISSRIRYFDRIFGHDRVLRFHGYMALGAMIAAIAHFCFKLIYGFNVNLQTGAGIAGAVLFLIIIVLTLLFMVNNNIGRNSRVKALKKMAEEKLKLDYSKLKVFHNFTSMAAAIIAIHALLASSTGESNRRILVLGGWAFTGISFFIYHKWIRPVSRGRLLKVTTVKQLTSEIVEIHMHHIKDSAVKYRAGQFGYFRLMSRMHNKEEHPFTISSQPGTDELSITVKNLGDYTSKLKKVEPGTDVLFDGPYGKFTPVQDGSHHIFVAGGIGITPFLSVINEWNFEEIKAPLTLIWSTRTADEMIYRDLFTRIESKNELFLFVPVLTRATNSISGSVRIDKTLLETVIRKKKIRNTAVYICGPDSLRISVIKDLKSAGIPSKNIHCEKFSF